MSAALAAALAVLKFLGWLLLILLAALLLLLCLPVVLAAEYRSEAVSAAARYGPFTFTLYPRPQKPGKAAPAQSSGQAAARAPKAESPAKAPEAGEGSPPAGTSPAAAPAAGPSRPATAPSAPSGWAQALLAAFRRDPLGMLTMALGHIAFAGGRLLRGVHVRHLQVYWTVTAADEDAAATAIRYGAQIALLNNLLVRAREHMDIQADFLYLEPDFTGEKCAGRGISGEISLRPIVLVILAPRLLFRLWRDPVFRTAFQ